MSGSSLAGRGEARPPVRDGLAGRRDRSTFEQLVGSCSSSLTACQRAVASARAGVLGDSLDGLFDGRRRSRPAWPRSRVHGGQARRVRARTRGTVRRAAGRSAVLAAAPGRPPRPVRPCPRRGCRPPAPPARPGVRPGAATSMCRPRSRAMSVMFRTRTSGRPISSSSVVRKRLRSRLEASTTSTTTSGARSAGSRGRPVPLRSKAVRL